MHNLITLVPLFPLLGFLIISFFGKYLKKEALIGGIASLAVGSSFVIVAMIFFSFLGQKVEEPHIVKVYEWISAGAFSVNLSYQVDQLSILFSLIITGVGFLIHIYSIGYMHGDRSYYRFFAYLNLFIFMMLNLVLSSNFLLTFFGWEGVGLCSYLLIGFWYDRKFEGVRIKWTGDAANKAFIVNRIGDFGFLVAMFIIFLTFNTLDYNTVNQSVANASSSFYGTGLMTAITMLLFLGCTGKSAQIPLAVWLPDAMAGPTPVSALIHAATMVTAGIFLIARNAVMFAVSPDTMAVITVVGVATAFFAASVGLVQNDFKKVLAYSTVSQLGFMFAALGVGAFTAGVFHVMTHAFFKGLLFLGAGSVIHSMHEEQNIKKMGGMKNYMPITYRTFWVATFAISGIPLFSGFFSKDEILWMVFSQGAVIGWLFLAVAAFFTAFYMYRLLTLVFNGKERFDVQKVHPHESPKTMTIPLIVLAVLSAFGGFLGVPHSLGGFISESPSMIHNWLEPIFKNAETVLAQYHGEPSHSLVLEYGLMLLSIAIAVGAILLAKKFYSDGKLDAPRKLANQFRPVYNMLLRKYKLDEFYSMAVVDTIFVSSKNFLWKIFDVKFIDGIVNGTANTVMNLGNVTRKLQSGVAQNYAVLMFAGIVAIISWLLIF